MSLTGEGLGETRIADWGRAPCDGQSAAAAEGIEMLAFSKGEDHLVSEGGRDCGVKDSGDTGLLARLMEFGAFLGLKARGAAAASSAR